LDITYTPDSGRDCLAEVYAELVQAIPDGGYIAAVVARGVIEKLKVSDPELVSGFGWKRAEIDAADYLARRSNSIRQTVRVMSPRTAFAEAAEEFEGTGNPEALYDFLEDAQYVVNDENLRLKLGDMRGSHHQYVVDGYATTIQCLAMEKAFHKALAKTVGDKLTREVYTSEQLLAMHQSITGNGPA
jgi:hypothetical protein